MREASLIFPIASDAPWKMGKLAQANAVIKEVLIQDYGGYTVHDAQGAWRDDDGEVHYDRNRVYTVAMEPLPENVKRLKELAQYAGTLADEQSVYVRLPTGDVEILTTPSHVQVAA